MSLMKSLDRQSLEEQARLVSRYVAGDLSRSERAEFEAWLVASPELAAEVEMERRLRRGIASAARRGWLKRGTEPVPEAREQRWRMAIAASTARYPKRKYPPTSRTRNDRALACQAAIGWAHAASERPSMTSCH